MTAITIQTINNFSRQEIFDYIALHLLKQNKRSEEEIIDPVTKIHKYACRYRGGTPEDPCKCAIGVLFDDEIYNPKFEGKTIKYLRSCYKSFSHIPLEVVPMLASLQKVHDNHDPTAWVTSLCEVARIYNLNTKAIDDYILNKDLSGHTGNSERPTS